MSWVAFSLTARDPVRNLRARAGPAGRIKSAVRSASYWSGERRPSRLGRFSANGLGFIGGLLPIRFDKALPIKTEPGHLLAQRPARDVELFHHARNLPAALGE